MTRRSFIPAWLHLPEDSYERQAVMAVAAVVGASCAIIFVLYAIVWWIER